MEIYLKVLGDPKTQKRHRMFRKGEMMGSYDPSAGEKRSFLALCHEQRPETPLDEPLRLCIWLYYKRPKSHYRAEKISKRLKRKVLRFDAPTYYASRPDIDNAAKFVFDALSGVFYRDDALIVMLEIVKQYSENPRTEIMIQTRI